MFSHKLAVGFSFGMLFASAVTCAQIQERRPVRAVNPIGTGDSVYLYAYATPDPEGPTIHCKGPGADCVANARLLVAKKATVSHDTALMEATASVNRILESLAPPPGKKLCIYRSPHGPVLLWAESDAMSRPPVAASAARSGALPAGAITDTEAIVKALGIEPAQSRQAVAAGGDRKATIIWIDNIPMWSCPDKGNDCSIGAFATARVHDGALGRATSQINDILDRASARPPKPGQRLCLLFLPDGPMLAWTYPEAKPAQRVITSSDPDFRRAAREALGLD
jgi:hypothetical protein